ncbi:MAG: chemotaxis protein CheW [Verrucomicrobiales bacterium]|nr:chemotaxis protein CheW [Verrucomicrobiales bacterium]
MSSELPEELRQDLLEEFYAECDELLASMGTHLGAVEVRSTAFERDRHLQELFRALHTFKGNCGIVGLRPAEQVAHAMEAVVRAVVRGELKLSSALVDSIGVATERLREFLVAHRGKLPLPRLNNLEREWTDWLSRERGEGIHPTPDGSQPEENEDASEEQDSGEKPEAWTCHFTPTPALAQQGVGIDVVRHRLSDIGKVLSCTPVVEASGRLSFVLTVELRVPPTDFAHWSRLGVRFEPPPDSPRQESFLDGSLKGGNAPAESDLAPSRLVRVDLTHLDELMRITGEILIQRFKLKDRLGDRFGDDDDLKLLDHSLGRSLRDLSSTLYRVRLVPIAEVFSRMPYVVRELIRGSQDEIRLRIEGEETEVDKYLVERLREPLLHLVRNAVAHAFDPPDVRLQQGKPREGTIVLHARRTGDAVEIRVADDGKGIDHRAIAERAMKLGLASPLSDGANPVLTTLCQSGFSTRDTPDRTAGRGEGMAIVARTVAELGGTLRLSTQVGVGSEFTLRLPLSLSIIEALIVSVAGQLCAIPQIHVDQVLQVSSAAVRTVGGAEFVCYRDGLLRVVRLRKIFRAVPSVDEDVTVLVIRSEGVAHALVVDSVRGQKEIVVSSFCDPLIRVPGVAGATEFGDGRPVLVIAPDDLVHSPRAGPAISESDLNSGPNTKGTL